MDLRELDYLGDGSIIESATGNIFRKYKNRWFLMSMDFDRSIEKTVAEVTILKEVEKPGPLDGFEAGDIITFDVDVVAKKNSSGYWAVTLSGKTYTDEELLRIWVCDKESIRKVGRING